MNMYEYIYIHTHTHTHTHTPLRPSATRHGSWKFFTYLLLPRAATQKKQTLPTMHTYIHAYTVLRHWYEGLDYIAFIYG